MAESFHLSLKQKIMTFFIVLIMIISYRINFFDFINVPLEILTVYLGDRNIPFHSDRIATILIDPTQDEDWKNKHAKEKEIDSPEIIKWSTKFRRSLAELIKKLTDVGARVIVVDYAFQIEEDMKYKYNKNKQLFSEAIQRVKEQGISESNELLREAIKRAKKRGTLVIISTDVDKDKPLLEPILQDAVDNKGYGVPEENERFGFSLRIPLAVIKNKISASSNEYKFYSLSLKAFESYWGGSIDIEQDGETSEIRRIKVRKNDICEPYICRFFNSGKNYFDNGDQFVFLYIDFSSIADEHKTVMPYENLNKNINNYELFKKFNSKIVLIGNATDNDSFITPIGKINGVMIHTNAVNTIFNDVEDGITIKPLTITLEYLFIIMFSIFGTFFTIKTIAKSKSFKIIIIISVAAICFSFSILLYKYGHERILTKWIYYFIAFLSTFGGTNFFCKKEKP